MAIAGLKRQVEEKSNEDIEAFISKGGSLPHESKGSSNSQDEELRMTFRCPKSLIDLLDKIRKERPGRVSRNQAIVEAINTYVTETSCT